MTTGIIPFGVKTIAQEFPVVLREPTLLNSVTLLSYHTLLKISSEMTRH